MTEQEWYARVGADLRYTREGLGWNLYDVAAVVNRSAAWVSYVERGKTRLKAYDYYLLRKEGLVA